MNKYSKVGLVAIVSFLFSQGLFCFENVEAAKDSVKKSVVLEEKKEAPKVKATPEPVRVVVSDDVVQEESKTVASGGTLKVVKAETDSKSDESEVEPFDFEKFAKLAKDIETGKFDKKLDKKTA